MSHTLVKSQETITITQEDILHEAKLSCKVPDLIEQILARKIIVSAASEANIKVTKEELQQTSDQMRVLNQLRDARSTWTWLEKHQLSLDNFEEIVYLALISRKLTEYLFADKVKPYFYDHQSDYMAATIYEIILDDEDEAIELFYEINEGEISFFEAAQQHIQDTELRRRGGYRDKVFRNDMKPEISAAVFAVKSTQLLRPIITADGVYIILVEEIIKPRLDEKLRQQITFDLFSQWLEKQKEQFEVVHLEARSKAIV